jgi:hypothetical protein
MLYKVSKNSRIGLPLSRAAVLHGVFVLGTVNQKVSSAPWDPIGHALSALFHADSVHEI